MRSKGPTNAVDVKLVVAVAFPFAAGANTETPGVYGEAAPIVVT
jgi:hypothetical protein